MFYLVAGGLYSIERVAEQSPSVRRARTRSLQRTKGILAAARKLVSEKGGEFTTQELVNEAGIAMQTFYRHFGSKDQLHLAMIGDLIAERCDELAEQGKQIQDPLEQLRFYVTETVRSARDEPMASPGSRFIATEHWRLYQAYPDEIDAAIRPVTELILEPLRMAVEAGTLSPVDPDRAAWLTTQLIMAVFHHNAFAEVQEPVDDIARRIWAFLLLGVRGPTGERH